MRVNPNDFLHSLAKFIVAQAAAMTPSVTLAYAEAPRGLWYNLAVETQTADPYSVLATYPGSPLVWGLRTDKLALQIETIGTTGPALKQAEVIFECFTDGAGRPLRMTTIDGFLSTNDSTDGHYQIVSAEPLQRPGVLTRESDRGKAIVTFNVELSFIKTN
jgi:hypothetical protein